MENPYDYASTLEKYLIPAEEGFIFSNITEENINKLGEKRTLIVFTTDDSLDYGGINIKKYVDSYKYTCAKGFPLLRYLNYRIKPDKYKCPKIDAELKTLLDDPKNVPCTDADIVSVVIRDILNTCDNYSRSKNSLVVAYLSDTHKFSYSYMRDYPVAISEVSMVKSVLRGLTKSSSMTIKQIKDNYTEFERFSKKIPPSAFVKDLKYDLFHISPNGDIKELTPRITNKPLKTENIIIPRVSAAPSIDNCFRAIGIGKLDWETVGKRTYYVYKLKLDKNHKVVKPPKKLVPDQGYTDEHWILDPVPVEVLGTITLSVDKTSGKIIFDTSDMSIDPMITTTWKKPIE